MFMLFVNELLFLLAVLSSSSTWILLQKVENIMKTFVFMQRKEADTGPEVS